jgi:hypothetical protein
VILRTTSLLCSERDHGVPDRSGTRLSSRSWSVVIEVTTRAAACAGTPRAMNWPMT